jgi:hypothetical protein
MRNYNMAFAARKLLDRGKASEAYTQAQSAATGRTATHAYPNWVLAWTDKASTTFGESERWTPTKIRLLRKAGRVEEASTLTLKCAVDAPDWRRHCQEANQTPAGRPRRAS